MNLNQMIRETLSAHGPIEQDFYKGSEEKYLVFNYPDEISALHGDNRPHKTIVDVQIHLYQSEEAPWQKEKDQICKELKKAGFLWPEVTVILEQETRKRHIAFETRIKRKIDWEE